MPLTSPRRPAILSHLQRSTLALALLALTGAAHAADDKIFSFSAFGTLGFANSSSSDGDYTGNQLQPHGTGNTHGWSPIDTKLAGQLTARVNDQFSAVVQVVSMLRTDNTYTPRVEWAFVKYSPTPALSLLIGRVVLPTFMGSETRLLGFSNPTVRPPLETYNLNPTTNLDGVSGSWRSNFGSVTNTVQAFYGKNTAKLIGPDGGILGPIEADPVKGVVDTVEFGSWTMRAGISQYKLSISPAPHFTINVPKFRQFNLGATYDNGTWFVQSEVSRSKDLELASDSLAYYATAGMRIDAFTPYVSYSTTEPKGTAFPTNSEQTTSSIGLRWDAVKNVAIKAQFDRVTLGAHSVGSFVNVKPAMLGRGSNVASVAVDFVY